MKVWRSFRLVAMLSPALGAGAGAYAGQAAAAEPGALPSAACVAAVREARIERGRGEEAAARAKLEGAVELSGCELPALSGLLQLLRASPASADIAALRSRLNARIADPATELPAGLVSQLARVTALPGDGFQRFDPGEHESDGLLVAALRGRLAAAASSGRMLAVSERAEILGAMAQLQQGIGDDAGERETLAQLLEIAPSDSVRWRALMFDVAHDRWESASSLLAVLVTQPEAPVFLRYLQVRALAHLGRYDEMARELDTLAPPPEPLAKGLTGSDPFEASPGSRFGTTGYVELLLESAWALRDAGRDAEAAALFRRVLVYAPDWAEAHAALLHLYGSDEERAAAAAATELRRNSETDPQRLFEEGSDLLGAGDAARAYDLLTRAAPELAGSAYAEAAWNNLGTAAFKLERWEAAAKAFTEACALNGTRVESQYKLGIALFHLGRCPEAIERLRRVLELQPGKKDARFYLAGCHDSLGDTAAGARERALFNAPE